MDTTRNVLFQIGQFEQKTQNSISFRAEAKECSHTLIFQNNGPTQKHSIPTESGDKSAKT
jgi:hypothetical protein